MTLKAQFGNGGTANTTKLADLNEAYALGGGSVSSSGAGGSNAGSVISEAPIAVAKVDVIPVGGGTGTGGSVAVGYSSTSNAFTFDASAWNAVKNASLTSDTAANVTLNDFVHVDIAFGGSGNSSVTVNDVKRGNVTTGSGNDTVAISLATNDSGWQNTFDVNTGAGNDSIRFLSGTTSGIAKVTDGRFTTVTIDAGAGNDIIDLSGVNLLKATITGGEGNDTMTGSNGKDVFVYNSIAGGSGFDIIHRFPVGPDELQFNGGVAIDDHFIKSGSTYIFLNDDTTIVLKGVTNYFPLEL